LNRHEVATKTKKKIRRRRKGRNNLALADKESLLVRESSSGTEWMNWMSLCLIKYYAMKTYGGVEIYTQCF
jgi:hypothetical protein